MFLASWSLEKENRERKGLQVSFEVSFLLILIHIFHIFFFILFDSTLLVYLGRIIWITCLTLLISGSHLYSAVVDLIAILVV